MAQDGPLFATTARAPAAWTVSETNLRARRLLEGQLGQVAVSGEVASLRRDASGHNWFSLKDAHAALAAVSFRRTPPPPLPLAVGQRVLVRGRLTVYALTGRYQLVAESIVQEGDGTLLAALEALKRRLAAEGLFAAQAKRRLPLLPRRVAVVTSPEGAVLRDILQVARRRQRSVDILVVPVRVQGPECAPSVVRGLASAAQDLPGGRCEVVILARGGGSLTDLWAFNDEQVVRAIAACPLPVVSGVGHETDFTLSDLAADVRAATPSVAAELVFADGLELAGRLRHLRLRQRQALLRAISRQRLRVGAARARLGDGRRPAWVQRQRLSDLFGRLERAWARTLGRSRSLLAARATRLQALHPRARLGRVAERTQALAARLAQAHVLGLGERRQRLARLLERVADLSPEHTLKRGYAMVWTPEGRLLRRAGDVAVGAALEVRLAEGALAVEVRGGDAGPAG